MYQSKQLDAAENLLKSVKSIRHSPQSHFLLGRIANDRGQVSDALVELQAAVELAPTYAVAWAEIGTIHFHQGRFAKAVHCFKRAIASDADMPEVHNNLGNAYREQGLITDAQACFREAIALRPTYALAHSNLLFALQYSNSSSLKGLRDAHIDWARLQVQGQENSPTKRGRKAGDEKLTIGFVSPDLYRHPVGVFLLPYLEHHDKERYLAICYSDSRREDDLSQKLRSHAGIWRTTGALDDASLSRLIQQDGVDILVDLAGHTAGNRLRMFGRRAAPVQLSWLGYSFTTGLSAMDYVLMDLVSAPPGYEEWFTETLLRLDGLRFCYSPPSYAPPVVAPPSRQSGLVTFGSFNNLAKLAPDVLQTWGEILLQVPASRLVLKWKSLEDAETQSRIRAMFEGWGVEGARIQFRGWSPHAEMLAEYGLVDIALDPFPFSGGLTTCDALYMGVPVITLMGGYPISRQSAGFLQAAGMDDLVATSRTEYIEKAIRLAGNPIELERLRASIRHRVLTSRICDGPAYARAIEAQLARCWQEDDNAVSVQQRVTMTKTFLHVGCGSKRKDRTTAAFNTPEWNESRLESDEKVNPDIVGTMTDMSAVANGSVDAIFSSHNIEHLYPHEVPVALAEFRRVLRSDGFLVVTCPDLQSVCALVAQDKLTEPAYTAPAGPIAPLDILYGYRPAMTKGNLFMAHRCGFTQRVLTATLQSAGFASVAVRRREHPHYDLWAVATMQRMEQDALRTLAVAHFPS